MGMFLTKLKTIAESNLNSKVVDCVISVPCYMTDTERRALLDASQIAGLNCLKLMNETTAVALTYGLYHSNLPEVTEKPHVVVFVDMGYTHLQASAVAFNKGKLRMIATTFDNSLGGRDFDRVLTEYFTADFKARYNIDANSNVRARSRLRTECEKLKKLMSSNSSTIPLNIECFMNDIDVSGKMKREDFEKLAEPLLARVRRTLQELLVEAKLNPKEIDLIEIVGGSTRIPAIKTIVQDVLTKEPSTTLNADEACSRGCTIMCAILSPNFKVKEFKIEDCQLFPITLSWKGAETDDNELEVFPKFEKIPLSKLLTIYKREPFEIEARYRFPNNIPFNEPRIGKFHIGNVTPNVLGENSEIKLKARITKNGIFEISSPQIIETVEVEQQQPQPQQQPQQQPQSPSAAGQAPNSNSTTTPQTPGEKAANEPQRQNSQNEGDVGNDDSNMNEEVVAGANGGEAAGQAASQSQQKTVKRKTKAVDLPLTAKVPQLTKTEINSLLEQEVQIQ
jgi:molecular chaperone DnaK (HSP70)